MKDIEIIRYIKEGGEEELNSALGIFYQLHINDLMKRLKFRMLKFGVSNQDVVDAFSEGLEDFVIQIREGKFRGHTLNELKAYLIQICYFKWKMEFDKTKKIKDERKMEEFKIYLQDSELKRKRFEVITMLFDQLKGDCPEILRAFFLNNKDRIATIMENLNLTIDQAKKRKNKCFEQLQTYLKNNAEQLDLLGG